MANTTSFAWPNIFNVSQNKVAIYEDNQSVISRCRLLMLTEPTELYNEIDQGVGLKRYMYRYNNDNVKAEICDRCKSQFALHEPFVNAPNTQWKSGLLSEDENTTVASSDQFHHLKMTIAVETIYGDMLEIEPNSSVN